MKTRHRHDSVKDFVTLGGSLIAVLGSVAAILAGGRIGIALGAGVLTTLIILQIFSLRGRTPAQADRMAGRANSTSVSSLNSFFDQTSLLVLEVSPFGRVRAIHGPAEWLPGLRIGVELEALVPSTQTSLAAPADVGTDGLTILRAVRPDGTLVMMLPDVFEPSAAQDELQERTSFFAGLGHDLKSPLNAVIGFADIMDAEIRGPMPDAYKDYPGLIRESGTALLRLVEDMLTYAKSEAGTYQLDIAPIDVAASAESVLRQSQAQAEQAGVRLRLTATEEVLALADASAVRRIWDNLVSNAIKYSAPGDTVTLSAFEQGDGVLLRVTDTGAGMDAEDLARIAKPFSQGRNAKGRSGTGLGLALVHRFAELQNGRVEIRTAPGTGTTVTVRLPGLARDQKRAAE